MEQHCSPILAVFWKGQCM
uniref:Uncharacterized protein n=1 Tax=Anguilla anguilla TaxID=7936 RepID=A0A0E9U1Z9_ANGAN